MRLKRGDRILYEDSIYIVVAVVWSIVYLRDVVDDSTGYDYDISEVHKNYRDIEFFGEG
mgnify:FL=1|jgi:hypothetical protein